MLRYLLDTNIVISALRRSSVVLDARLASEAGSMAVSAITATELYFGAEGSAARSVNLRAVEELFSLIKLLDFACPAAGHAASIRADLTQRGLIIGPYDVLIAGQARSAGLCLITNNRREFDRVDGLRVEDWTTA